MPKAETYFHYCSNDPASKDLVPVAHFLYNHLEEKDAIRSKLHVQQFCEVHFQIAVSCSASVFTATLHLGEFDPRRYNNLVVLLQQLEGEMVRRRAVGLQQGLHRRDATARSSGEHRR